MNVISASKRSGLALLLFAVVYAPAFAAVAWLHRQHLWCASGADRHCPSDRIAVPVIIAVSAALAALSIMLLARGKKGIAEFGVARSRPPYVVAAVLSGLLAGGAVAYFAAKYPAPSPLDLSKLPLGLTVAYFVFAAPFQEELIFRGLLQTTVARFAPASGGFWAVHYPVLFVALLFGAVHLGSGPVVAIGGLLLGLIAGELRRMSGSLLPAILVHSLFNAMSLWPT
ncbi:MAG: CPBP family intramembrane metalloprotease [Alphaproteobacteria bacterium]|nr:CPBP family intramembrane metalloprotease [Alphaproteobacteria bacterium]MDE2496123.1 CPBP family intramembrane metalloprotease [Alphaproteobacteria bacterium]